MRVPCPQYEAQPTPATPVSAEALSSLLSMIKQVPNDGASSQHKRGSNRRSTMPSLTIEINS
ncbi:hypothetical protein BU26DRAFT_76132 [Trematosphaeria pertusa]|uniref:Uncharacterized protein n=1 Tax=Trematosphaeria pertusa TaxID=390896 RepID=A0A6A6I3Z7_9PLEO|nr:uncharacterized protein BU26DRAFT_76132 [Trematosphaeria pertusa]KAF2245071.1 hypothetical protein BU26DRAFT_76132 [Trematosphaeria pertusa]